ncbi:hypothetical protein BJF92_05105 [Rhizobium rhizosphaerae]|uniref:Uncharacterized protein n=1 Tax=Xaviernesmea rhizosphaerae TaxID=1672749 RepID=A0A1Q9AF38_9HYPH|nr:lysylphosphatidylglycerol synthase domain-containing protein [Xaviernesmea rhizosphaerae]OLP53544.1 hypothetical protein BJF92_05105 [Xaviernesmea rhizosphaerae]OQP86266.1 hypothetical protein BTR14_11255 [Xaviernesmea rhizosphaerae]
MTFRLLLRAVMIVAIIAAVYLLVRTLREYSLDEILQALRSIPLSHFAASLAFAFASYFCLSCFDAMGVRYAGKRLAFHRTLLTSFVSLSIGHNVGVAALSSGAVRYRYYARWGLTAEDVAKIVLFCGVTVGIGLMTLGSLGLFLRPQEAVQMTGLSSSAVFTLAIVSALLPVVYVILAATLRKPLQLRSWSFTMPSLRLALGQVLFGTLNFACVAASLHQMLSAFSEANYLKVAAVSIIANVAAIISHVPGGIGVLEATVAHILPGAQSVAAVIAFRVAYYFIPLAIGLPLLIGSEMLIRKSDKARPRHEDEAPEGHAHPA